MTEKPEANPGSFFGTGYCQSVVTERCVAATAATAVLKLEFSENERLKCIEKTLPTKDIRNFKVCHLAVTRKALLLHSLLTYSVSMLAVLASVGG